jgi:PAS domain S-box-containing protein
MPFKNTGTLLLTLDGRIAFASTYFCDLVGIGYDTAVGMSWFDFVFREDMRAAWDLFVTAKLPHADPSFRLRRLDGSVVWTEIQASHLQTPGGRTYAVTATVTKANANREEIGEREWT